MITKLPQSIIHDHVNFAKPLVGCVGGFGGLVRGSSGGGPAPHSSEYSLLFDGGDEIAVIPSHASINFDGDSPFSISAWIKPTNFFGGNNTSILSKGDYNMPLQGYNFMHSASGKLMFYMVGSYGADHVGVKTDTAVLSLDTWQHVLVVYKDRTWSNTKFYFNGVLQTTVLHDGGTFTLSSATANDLTIGRSTVFNNFYAGNQDDVAIYNVELDQTAATALALTTTDPATIAGCVAHWPMGDGDTYPTIQDAVGSNDGTMTNMEAGDIVADAP